MTAEWDAALSWLRARLDEEEKLGNAAGLEAGFRWEGTEAGILRADGPSGWPTAPFIDDSADGFLDRQLAEHIARHDPAAVLRRVRSDRRILEWAVQMRAWAVDNNLWSYDEWQPLKLLALRFVGLSGFPEVLRLEGVDA